MTVALQVGLVGAGSMGALHARVLATNERTRLSWIADPDPRAKAVAERYGAAWMPEPEFTGVDAMVIAAPTELHPELAVRAIDAGLPLLLEKPLAATLPAAQAIVAAASARGQVLMCGLLERFNAAVRTATEIARDPIHVTTVRHSPYAERIRTGVASDLLIHDIDLVLRLFGGMPVSSTGHFGYFEPRSVSTSEDVADATLRFDRGQIASLSVSRVSQTKLRSMRITELDRVIDVDLLRQDITIYRHVQDPTFDEEAGYRQQTIIDIPVVRNPGEPLQLQLQHFLRLVDGTADRVAELDTLLPAHVVLHDIEAAASAAPGGSGTPA